MLKPLQYCWQMLCKNVQDKLVKYLVEFGGRTDLYILGGRAPLLA